MVLLLDRKCYSGVDKYCSSRGYSIMLWLKWYRSRATYVKGVKVRCHICVHTVTWYGYDCVYDTNVISERKFSLGKLKNVRSIVVRKML